ncbi:MAG: PxKF domain-containing protein [Actinobacteria bacterium]|nr:PxKF domain-containing protein [Actinomycetota bacterium]
MLLVGATLLATVVPHTAAAGQPADDPSGPYTDQTVAGTTPPDGTPPDPDPSCDTTEFPGQRSLIGTTQTQTFVPSRSDLRALDLCITSNVPNVELTVTVTSEGDPGAASSQTDAEIQVGHAYFHRVTFETPDGDPLDLDLTPGKSYTITVKGPAAVDVPSAVLAWRLTCQPIDPLLACDGSLPDRYADGIAGEGKFGTKADFGFRTLTPETADLHAQVLETPRNICRDRTYPAEIRVTNSGAADVRDTTLLVELSQDDIRDPGDVLLASVPIAGAGLGHERSITVPTDLRVPPDALGAFGGRARLIVTVDESERVVESDETNNESAVETVVTSCAPAAIEGLTLTADRAAVAAGVGEVPVTDLPVASIPFAGTGLAATPLNANPLNANPLNANPLNANPLLHAPLNANPLNANPLNANPLNANPLNANSFLFGAPYRVLEQVPLTSVALLRAGGWQAVLDRHAEIVAATGQGSEPRNHVALQHLSLLDVMTLDPVPQPPIRWGEIDLAASGLGGLVLAAVATGATALEDIHLPSGQSWCAYLEEAAFHCSEAGLDEHTATLVTLNLLGLDMTAIPFNEIGMDAIALHPSSPLATVPLQSPDPALQFDARLTSWATVPLSGPLTELVDCASVACDGSADVAAATEADAFEPGRTVGDLLAALPRAALKDATLGETILGTIHNAASLPFEGVQLDRLDLAERFQPGPFVTYTLSADVAPDGASLVDPVFRILLPPGFAYVPDSATLQADDQSAVLGEPTTRPEGERVALTWQPDLYVAAGTRASLSLQTNPGRVLGSFTAVGSVHGDDLSAAGAYAASTDESAPVDVIERFEPNGPDDPADGWVEVPSDTLVLSHIGEPGDLDVWRIPVPAEPHSRVKIVLSHLPEDYDLILGGATANPLNANPLNANPLNANPLNANPLNANRVVPESGTEWHANGTDGTTPPETLQDLPLNANPLNANGVRAVSIERGTTHETIIIETVDGEGGYYPLIVSGYNGAASVEPYVLRHHVIAPHRIDLGACQPKPFASGTDEDGTLPDPRTVDPQTDTLFLLARQRISDRFGTQDRDALLTKVGDVGVRHDLGIRGLVVPIAGTHWDPDTTNPVADAYARWDASRCDPVAANEVAGAVRDLVLEYRKHLPIAHVVVLGDDDQIPFLRVRDGSVLANEVNFVSTAVADLGEDAGGATPANGTPLTAALQAGLFLTDDHLGTAQARPWLDHGVWLPDIGVGRLTGDVTTMIGSLERFLGSDGRLDPQILDPAAAAVAGYDHLSDGAHLVAQRLQNRLNTATSTLIGETWDRAALDELLTFDTTGREVVASVNGHADHRRFLPALGNLTGSAQELYEAGDLASFPVGSLVFSMACHLGYDLPAGDPGDVRDWADDVMQRRGVLLANSGFNYGDTETVAAGELYAALFADSLDGQLTVGQVNALTKTEMYAREGTYGAEFLKAMQGMVLFGLPFYRVAATGDVEDPAALPSPQPDPVTGLDVVDLTIELPLATQAADCPDGSSCLVPELTASGLIHRVVGPLGYEPLAVSGRPTGPRAILDLTELLAAGQRVHGAALLGATSVDLEDVDPVFARSVVDRGDREPEPQALGTIFPTSPLQVSTVDTVLGERQVLTVLPWTFRTDRQEDGRVIGDLRLDTSLSIRLYLSEAADNVPPQILDVEARRQGPDVTFRVSTLEANAQAATVVATYRDHHGTWHHARLSSGDGRTWFGVGPLPGTAEGPIDVLVQVVDADGDVGYWRHKGERLPLSGRGDVAFELAGTPGDNGWFRSAVTVTLDPAGAPYQRRVDGGPWEELLDGPSFTVATDGIHRFDVRASDGSLSRDIVIAIDTTGPVVTIASPAHGARYLTTDTVVTDFTCTDPTSGTATCVGTHPPGSLLPLAYGEDQTFEAAGKDRAGNRSTATSVYDVYEPPVEFRGFYSPVANDVFNQVDREVDAVPFKWRLYRGGVALQDTSAIAALRWSPVACAASTDAATPTGDPIPATSVNNQGVMLISDRMQFDAVIPEPFRGTCQRFELKLTDGQQINAWFRFSS